MSSQEFYQTTRYSPEVARKGSIIRDCATIVERNTGMAVTPAIQQRNRDDVRRLIKEAEALLALI